MSKKDKINNIDVHLENALDNIGNDRAMASTLLVDLMGHISNDETKHQQSGPVAAKYLEVLQRSNEQLVKIVSLMNKRTSAATGLSEDDKNDIFDLLNEDSKEN